MDGLKMLMGFRREEVCQALFCGGIPRVASLARKCHLLHHMCVCH